MRRLLVVPILAVAVIGCASQPLNAPSLLPRAIENRSEAEAVRVPAPVVADAALDAEIARRSAAFDAAVRAYDAAVPATERKLQTGRSAAEGSERWLDAQTALAELGQARAAIDGALAAIEALAITRDAANDPPYPALDAALAVAQARFDAAAATDARLRAILPG